MKRHLIVLFLAVACPFAYSQQPKTPAASSRVDSSILPVSITSEVVDSRFTEGFLHEEIIFKDGEKTLMVRSVWLTPDRSKIVRCGHIAFMNGKDAISIVDLRDPAELHCTHVMALPPGIHLSVNEADAFSPAEWRFFDDAQKILASFSRTPDGLIKPMTRAEFEAMLGERAKKLATH